jgi:4-aminobutyrate aminotransferase-like enzyme
MKSLHLTAPRDEAQAEGLAQAKRKSDLVFRKSADYLNLVTGHDLDAAAKDEILRKTLENFDDYFNRGFLHYRKSVAEAGDFAAIEWTGQGSIIEDLMGRRFIDCLGGFGVYNMGIRHPTIVGAVRAQLERMPLSSQELLDPLRGYLAELLGELAPGDLQDCFFINNGTDAVEGGAQAGPAVHQEDWFHRGHGRLPWQVHGIPFRDGQGGVSEAFCPLAGGCVLRGLR